MDNYNLAWFSNGSNVHADDKAYEYEMYLKCENAGNGTSFIDGKKLKSFDEWNS